MSKVEQNTQIRTSRTGLTACDLDQACPGYVIYTPIAGDGIVYAIDVQGREAHHWKMPYAPGLWGYLLPNGNLFYNGKIVKDETWGRFESWKAFKGGVILEAEMDGTVVWEHRDPDHHHDARRTEGGGAVYLSMEPMTEDLARRVQGGHSADEAEQMWADVIVEVDSAGNRIWEWHAIEHLEPAVHRLTFNDHRTEWSHGNTIAPLPGDRVLASFRNISTVAIISKASGKMEWQLGPDVLAQQHDPSLLDNGNILVLDNGSHRRDNGLPFTRVLEINPEGNEIVWSYQDPTPYSFFSAYISGARRLGNGNTLITEGVTGRMFQVTPSGEVVWEYINPHFHIHIRGHQSNAVFRASLQPPGLVEGMP